MNLGLCKLVDFAISSLDSATRWRQTGLEWLVWRQVVSGGLVGLVARTLIVRLLQTGRDGIERLVAQQESLA